MPKGPGMQVHAVPESERWVDKHGRKLPWGYEHEGDNKSTWAHQEKGPFGRATRLRGPRSSKTPGAHASKRDDHQANLDAVDALFSKRPAAGRKAIEPPPNDTLQASQQPIGPLIKSELEKKQPTRVMLYGYKAADQWKAIEIFEKISGGVIYEDYARHPPTANITSHVTEEHTRALKKISDDGKKMKNVYHGGNHWIKVTFDSYEAAEQACHASPHLINGHYVHAAFFRDIAPSDVPIPQVYHNAISATADDDERSRQSSRTLDSSSSSSSATITSSRRRSTRPYAQPAVDPLATPRPKPPLQSQSSSTLRAPGTSFAVGDVAHTTTSAAAAASLSPPPLRVRGAKRAVLLPAEEALLPVGNRWQLLLASLPIISLFVGAGAGPGIFGNEVPRCDDGSFDWTNANLYWKLWYLLDQFFGTDFLGVGDDDD